MVAVGMMILLLQGVEWVRLCFSNPSAICFQSKKDNAGVPGLVRLKPNRQSSGERLPVSDRAVIVGMNRSSSKADVDDVSQLRIKGSSSMFRLVF